MDFQSQDLSPTAHYIRIGVDVGGTFTKAVALGVAPVRLIARAVVPTTHDDPNGVARGIVDALTAILREPAVQAGSIVSVGHSTTQAVNALLEGDVASVGIIAFGPARGAVALRKRATPGAIALAPGRALPTVTVWLAQPFTDPDIDRALDSLIAGGCAALVASGLFAVDDPADEQRIMVRAAARGLPAVGGHQVSSNYGLEIRTTTAAINASILPRMRATTAYVQRCLTDAGITVPLMIMRGDGGLADAETLRNRPVFALLSGPAASVAGALLHAHTLDGVFIEVGGTSTNIVLIRDGAPILRYVEIMNHPTCIRSLDVRVQGIAGGSLARLSGNRLHDVGPRSAHIAGLPYLCYHTPALPLTLGLISPKPDDPADYVTLTDAGGIRYALTVTCAAAARDGNPAALAGFAVLGSALGMDAKQAAQTLLALAARPIAHAADRLIREHKIPLHRVQLLGGGGGAAALLPTVAAMLDAPFAIVDHADVISSIGVALAFVRVEVERALDSATGAQLADEARAQAIANGAAPDSIQINTEIITERATMRAVALGAVALEGAVPDSLEAPARSLDDLRSVAAQRVIIPIDRVALFGQLGRYCLFLCKPGGVLRAGWAGVVVIDQAGAVKFTGRGAVAFLHTDPDLPKKLAKAGQRFTIIEAGRLLTVTDGAAAQTAIDSAHGPYAVVIEPVSFW